MPFSRALSAVLLLLFGALGLLASACGAFFGIAGLFAGDRTAVPGGVIYFLAGVAIVAVCVIQWQRLHRIDATEDKESD